MNKPKSRYITTQIITNNQFPIKMIILTNTYKTQALANDILQWSNATFTAQRDALPMLHHLKKEVIELFDACMKIESDQNVTVENMNALKMEMADCFMLILDAVSHFNLPIVAMHRTYCPNKSFLKLEKAIEEETLMQYIPLKLEETIQTFEIYQQNNGINPDLKVVLKNYFTALYVALIAFAAHIEIDRDELLYYTRQKLEINKKRKWGKPDANGVVEHVREKMEPVKVNVAINGNPKEKFLQGGIPFSQLDAKPGVEDFSFQHTQYIMQEQIRRSSEAQTKLIAHKLLEKIGQYIPGLTHDNLVHHIRYVSVVNKGDVSTYIYYPPHDNSPSSPVPLFNTQWTTQVQNQRNPEDDYRVTSFFTITDIR